MTIPSCRPGKQAWDEHLAMVEVELDDVSKSLGSRIDELEKELRESENKIGNLEWERQHLTGCVDGLQSKVLDTRVLF